ncbi:hypothetical protein CMV_018320 [Castanea mollissima]|uniref:Mannosyltransferase n=1 Tax=Castanea mollissima TaxID=60419 RepID=A0A8J4R2K2_9ROSI|nr:hypothetical protein CMV_018320 [Castanea mollissima]
MKFMLSAGLVKCLSLGSYSTEGYNNRKKTFWKLLNFIMLGLLLISLGCTIITFMASYNNYPSGHALKDLHQIGHLPNNTNEQWVHIDPFSAMNGISRFCETEYPWRYSKEEEIPLEEFCHRNFTFLINEHCYIDGFKCLFSINGFSRTRLQIGFPPLLLLKEPKAARNYLEVTISCLRFALDQMAQDPRPTGLDGLQTMLKPKQRCHLHKIINPFPFLCIT